MQRDPRAFSEQGKPDMAQTAKTQPSRLTPLPKALQKALEQSAKQAQRVAAAFGLVVPDIKPMQSQPFTNRLLK